MKIRILIAALGFFAVIYGADDLSIRYRIPKSRQAFGTVTIRRYDAISERSKTEFVFEEPINQTCVQSPFPHLGYQPCWYLSRHGEQRINY